MFKGIIFDCDGVLFESTSANLAFYNKIILEMGGEPVDPQDRERVHLCHTASSPVVLSTLLGPDRGEQALALAARMGYEDFIPHMNPEEGVFEALEHLNRQMPLAVATNRGGSIGPILNHFQIRQHFQAVVCCRDVAQPKPAPDMLFLASEQLGIPCGNLLFVGDSELDQRAAAGAGMPFAAFKSRATGDYSLGCFPDLLDLLERGA